MSQGHVLEVDMDLSTTSDGRHIVSSDISTNGGYVCAAFTTRVTLYSLHEHLSKKLKKLKQKPMLQVTPCRMPDSSDDEAVQDALNVFRRGAHYIQFFPASTIVAIASKTLQKLKGGGTQLVPIVHIVQLPSTGTATDGSSTTLIIPPRLLMQLSVDHGSNDVTPYDAIAVSPDGTFVAGGTIGGTVRLWSIGNGGKVVCRALPTLQGVHHTSLSFSPTGESLVMLCDDNTFHVWDVDLSKVRCEVCFVFVLPKGALSEPSELTFVSLFFFFFHFCFSFCCSF